MTNIDTAIEDLIDAVGLSGVLESLDRVCYAKSDHIRGAWQDHDLADRWLEASLQIEKLIRKFPTAVPGGPF